MKEFRFAPLKTESPSPETEGKLNSTRKDDNLLSCLLNTTKRRFQGQTGSTAQAVEPIKVGQHLCEPRGAWIANPYYSIDSSNKGKIYFPKQNLAPAAGPIALFVHGNPGKDLGPAYPFYDVAYEYLLRSIASCGIIAISISAALGESPLARSERVITHLKSIRAKIKDKGVQLPRQVPLALMGHSRGGEAAIIAAHRVADGDAPGFSDPAVVCLAPTRINVVSSVGAFLSPHVLILHGGSDGDQVKAQGAQWFDPLLSSTNAAPAFLDPIQSLFWIHQGTHGGFLDHLWAKDNSVTTTHTDAITNQWKTAKFIRFETQNWITRTLVSAFLRTVLLKDSKYRAWFYAGDKPGWEPYNEVVASDFAGDMKIYPLYHRPVSHTLCSGNACLVSGGMVAAVWTSSKVIADYRLARNAALLKWNRLINAVPYVVFKLEAPVQLPLDGLCFEMDVSQPKGATGEVKIEILVTGKLVDSFVQVPVVYPQVIPEHDSNVVVSTIRVPLSLFPSIKASSGIHSVVLSFYKSPTSGTILVTNPRFAL